MKTIFSTKAAFAQCAVTGHCGGGYSNEFKSSDISRVYSVHSALLDFAKTNPNCGIGGITTTHRNISMNVEVVLRVDWVPVRNISPNQITQCESGITSIFNAALNRS